MRALYPSLEILFFRGERKTGEPGEKPLEQCENQRHTRTVYRTRATLVEGERSHLCARS